MDLLIKNKKSEATLTGGCIQAMEGVVRGYELLLDLEGKLWRDWVKLERKGWFLRLKEEQAVFQKALAVKEALWRDKEHEKQFNAFIGEGVCNSKIFQKMRVGHARKPNGEAKGRKW